MAEKQYIGFWPDDKYPNRYKQSKPVEVGGHKYWATLYDNREEIQSGTRNPAGPLFSVELKPIEAQREQPAAYQSIPF